MSVTFKNKSRSMYDPSERDAAIGLLTAKSELIDDLQEYMDAKAAFLDKNRDGSKVERFKLAELKKYQMKLVEELAMYQAENKLAKIGEDDLVIPFLGTFPGAEDIVNYASGMRREQDVKSYYALPFDMRVKFQQFIGPVPAAPAQQTPPKLGGHGARAPIRRHANSYPMLFRRPPIYRY